MKTIALYGLATEDQIVILNSDYHDGSHTPFQVKYRPGGIFNVQRAIRHYTQDFGISLVYGNIDKVIVNVWKNRKQSFPRFSWTRTLNPVQADWHHIAYLDELTQYWSPEILSNFKGIVSADLCGSNLLDYRAIELLPHIDYLFMSDDNILAAKANKYANLVRKGVLVHSAKSVAFFHNESVLQVTQPRFDDSLIDIVGAGDYFAGGFICAKLYNNNDKDACLVGHQVASVMLKDQR